VQPPSRIVIPVDFSERTQQAVCYAKMLATRLRAELTMLHVLEPPNIGWAALENGGALLSEVRASLLARLEGDLGALFECDLRPLHPKRVLLEGDPATEIVEYARREKTELLVMPTHGYGRFRRFILGSVTAKVLHDADCPVWTGAHFPQTRIDRVPQIGTILCAVDLRPTSKPVLAWASMLAQALDARLFVMHSLPGIGEGKEGEYFGGEWSHPAVEAARRTLSEWEEELSLSAHLLVTGGTPVQAVSRQVEELQADLAVIGRSAAEGATGRLRANAYAIIRQLPCPVVSV
jgi:nucleotide-binding universal stress UspA family protein